MARDACLELAPVEVNYTPKGKWEELAGMKTYIVGPQDATRAIIFVYDIFGPAPQSQQGADRMSAHTSSLVVMPDFFQGSYPDRAWFPADSDEKKNAYTKWRSETADIGKTVEKLLRARQAVGEKWPGVDEHVGVFGLCWGGKVAVVACGAGNEGAGRRFTVSGTAHPGALDAADAKALTAAHICLASPGEPQDVVAQYKEILSGPGKVGHVETVPGTFHGWMGARANLSDEKNVKDYENGYKKASEFFLENI